MKSKQKNNNNTNLKERKGRNERKNWNDLYFVIKQLYAGQKPIKIFFITTKTKHKYVWR